MAAAIGIAKTATEIFLGVGEVSIDNLTFKLHYKWSVTLFIVCSVLVQTSQFFGDPVQCETVSSLQARIESDLGKIPHRNRRYHFDNRDHVLVKLWSSFHFSLAWSISQLRDEIWGKFQKW